MSYPNCIVVVVLKNCESDYWKVLSVVPLFKNVQEKYTTKNDRPVSLLFLIGKVCKKLITGLLITWRNMPYFMISFMVLGLPDQLQIFKQFYLIELLGFLTSLRLLEL